MGFLSGFGKMIGRGSAGATSKALSTAAADRAILKANPVGGYASIGKAPSTFAGSIPKKPLNTV